MNPAAPRKIIHVPRRFVAEEWGGTETVILEISRQQQRAGWQPEILTSMALAKQRNENIGGVLVKRFPYCYPFFGLTAADKAALDKKGGNLLSLSLFNALRRDGLDLDTLSMGMSGDLEAAIHCGSTLVRVGSAIFGARQ